MFSRMLSLSTAILACAIATIASAPDSAIAQAAAAAQRPNIKTLFRGILSSGAEIYLPSDPVVTQRWTLHEKPTYFGAIKVGTEGDVVTIVRIATKFGIPFLATGGGHGTSITLGNLNRGLEIDMSKLSSVNVDTTNNQITVGGGTRFSQVVDLLYAAKKEMQIGTATCVGMIGATLGGGVSQQQGIHGLLIDTLVSVRLVTADGNAITVSKTQNLDLFFGLRGAGQNFGIVTSATYKIFDWTNGGQVLSANFEYAGSANSSLWQILQSFDNNMPALLAINYAVAYDPSSGTSGFVINANYYGLQDEGLKYLQPFVDLKPALSSLKMLPSTEVLADAYFGLDKTGCVDGQYINAYTIGVKQTTPSTFESVFADLTTFNAQHATDVHVGLVVHRWPQQAVLAVPDGDTAYPWRQIKMHIQIESNYASNNTALEKTVNDFSQAARAKYQQTSGFDILATYSNFAHGDEGPSSWYGAQNLPKLKTLKKKWDLRQLFSFYNGLPLN